MDKVSSVIRNANWFRNSGIMTPPSGEWGVAERVAVMKDNSAAEKIYKGFPAYTPFRDYALLESRRADCNFETALMFLLLQEFTGNPADEKTGESILDFLYYRSGLLNRSSETHDLGVWQWSHVWREWYLWLDDNSWCVFIQILLGMRYPHLDRKYGLVEWGVRLARTLLKVFRRTFRPDMGLGKAFDPEKEFCGDLSLPHFGALVMMAFLAADKADPDPEYRKAAEEYCRHLDSQLLNFNASELSYILIALPLIAEHWKEEDLFAALTRRTAAELQKRFRENPYGNLPAEHSEAPCGGHLVDLIYTTNWGFLGFVHFAAFSGKQEDFDAAEKMASMLISIQDSSPEPCFQGCWRGMYDLSANDWGGGDCAEGGANSIYSGWTNAPISIAMMLLTRKEGLGNLFHPVC